MGLVICLFILTLFIFWVAWHIPVALLGVPASCFLVILAGGRHDLKGIMFYWTWIVLQLALLLLIAYGIFSALGVGQVYLPFSVACLYLIREMGRFLSIEFSAGRRSRNLVFFFYAVLLAIGQLLVTWRHLYYSEY